MGVRPPILRRIRQIWYFSLAGSWVKGQMRTSSPRGLLADEDELAARASCHRLVGPGKRLSPRNFFNFRPIWTKFYLLVTWNHGRLPIDFGQNRTGLIFLSALAGGKGAMRLRWLRSWPVNAPTTDWTARENYTVPKTFSFLARSAWNLAHTTMMSRDHHPPDLSGMRQLWIFGPI